MIKRSVERSKVEPDKGGGYRVTIESGEVVAVGLASKLEAEITAHFADEVAEMLATSEFKSGWCLRGTDLLRILQISPCTTFVLVERLARSNGQWLNVGVFTTTAKGVSAVWQFGWSCARVSNTASSRDLEARHPSIFEWAVATLRTIGTADDEALRRCHRDSLSRVIDHLCDERRQLLNELAALEAEIQRNEARLREYDTENLQPDGGNAVSLDVT